MMASDSDQPAGFVPLLHIDSLPRIRVTNGIQRFIQGYHSVIVTALHLRYPLNREILE